MSKENFSYEKAMGEIEQILAELENGNVGIDDLLGKVKRAGELIQACKTKLTVAEKEIGALLNDNSNTPSEN